MLIFEPSSILLDGNVYTVYPDTLNPLQWYYLSTTPRVTQIDDRLQFHLIKYRAGGGKEGPRGGWLIVTVDLGLPNEIKRQLQAQLQAQQNLDALPSLSSPLWSNGHVELMVLNKAQSVQPTFLGDTQASFSIRLSPEELSLFEKSLEKGSPLLGIAYSLDYEGIRPAYKFEIDIKWDQVQTYLEKSFQAGAVIFNLDISNVVETLEEDKHIRINLENYETDESKVKARKIAFQEIKEMLLSQFFEPAISPVESEAEAAPKFGFRFVTVDIQSAQNRALNLTMNTRVAVQRRTFPQGRGTGWPQSPQALSPYVKEISLDDAYFRDRSVKVFCLANFATDNIAQINVTLKYGDREKSLVFNSAIGSKIASWPSLRKVDGAMRRDVIIRYKVVFKVIDGKQWPTFESSADVTLNDHWVLNPSQLYRIQPIQITSLHDFPWSKYRSVLVELKYQNTTNNLMLSRFCELTEKTPEGEWKLLLHSQKENQLQYKITYVSVDRKKTVIPWSMSQGSMIAYDEFLPQERKGPYMLFQS